MLFSLLLNANILRYPFTAIYVHLSILLYLLFNKLISNLQSLFILIRLSFLIYIVKIKKVFAIPQHVLYHHKPFFMCQKGIIFIATVHT